MFRIGDKVRHDDMIGVITEVLGFGCYMVRFKGEPEDWQDREEYLTLIERT